MQPRSIEILETIRRSSKAFTEHDVLDFAREIERLASEERAALFKKPRAKRPLPARDPTPSIAPKLVRGMKADRARDAILALFEQERPEQLAKFTTAEKKTYAAVCRGVARLLGSAAVADLVKDAIERYSGTTSTDWQQKPAS